MRPKTCRVCKAKFAPRSTLQVACSVSCTIQLTKSQKDKKEKTENKLARDSVKTRSQLAAEAQRAFNDFIRQRDKNLPCISCQTIHASNWHAGHYRSVGAAPELRFCEEQVHKQCAKCNTHLSGNLIGYRVGLVNRIGQERVEWIEGIHTPKRYNADELREIRLAYKDKLRELRKKFTS